MSIKARAIVGWIALFAPLALLLAGSIWFALRAWTDLEGPPMPLAGWLAMLGGIVVTLLVGVGLMSLLFYSRRHGYDDAVEHRPGTDMPAERHNDRHDGH